MKKIWNLTALLTVTLGLAACGGGGAPTPTPGPGDTTPPSVVSITPASGATGVAKDANIVVVFSEKMNQAATQAAYQSTDLPASGVTFSWNAEGTTLTINPNADLAYTAAGKTYAFNLITTATDVVGNALPATASSFKTFRQITTTLSSTAALDGWVRSDGLVETSSELRVGDSADVSNATYRSYLSFDLSGLPAGLQSANLVSATLSVHQFAVNGTPYTDLDVGFSDLILEHVDYGAGLSGTDFDPTVYANLSDISSSATAGTYSNAVLSTVKADVGGGRTRSQYRLRFAKLTDGDGSADLAYMESGDAATNKPRLELTYLIP